jgi:hypothetical protein
MVGVKQGPITQFLEHHFRHFNAATVVDAADSYRTHIDKGGKMMVTLAGAMSTAELGLSLAEMIRQDKVQADLLHRRQSGRGRFSTSSPTTTINENAPLP